MSFSSLTMIFEAGKDREFRDTVNTVSIKPGWIEAIFWLGTGVGEPIF